MPCSAIFPGEAEAAVQVGRLVRRAGTSAAAAAEDGAVAVAVAAASREGAEALVAVVAVEAGELRIGRDPNVRFQDLCDKSGCSSP